MARIFISYRRDDSRGDAGRLYDRLVDHFGIKSVFRDVDTIAPGEMFLNTIDAQVRASDVVLVIIGPRWMSLRRAEQRRLDRADDYVRLEIATAIRLGIPVIPILVGNAVMPQAQDLPTDIRLLASFQAAVLSEAHFPRDLQSLVSTIGNITSKTVEADASPFGDDLNRGEGTDPKFSTDRSVWAVARDLFRGARWIIRQRWFKWPFGATVILPLALVPAVSTYAEAVAVIRWSLFALLAWIGMLLVLTVVVFLTSAKHRLRPKG